MTKKMRLAAVITAVAVLFVMLFSAFYIRANANHHCEGEDCPICFEINACESALKSISHTIIGLVSALLLIVVIPKIAEAHTLFSAPKTPITLKTKLLN